MKNIFLSILFTVSLVVHANPIVDDAVIKALKNGNEKVLANYFNTSIDLTIPNNEGVFSKEQAELILKTFFDKSKPSNFKVVHDGDSKNNAHYAIGNLNTNQGTYRTYILYKKNSTRITILELRIESDE